MKVDDRPNYGSGAGGLFSLPFSLLSLLLLLLSTLYFASGPCNPLLYVMIMDTLDVLVFLCLEATIGFWVVILELGSGAGGVDCSEALLRLWDLR